jgi:hypothetical protein
MTLVVESGSITPGAESYISVTDANDYHLMLGNSAWDDLSTAGKEEALRKATNYMLGRYGDDWLGYRVSSSQVLDWPRQFVPIADLRYLEYVSDSVVPTEIKNACASLALRASSESLQPDEEQRVVREKVDVIETEYSEYSQSQKKYPEIDRMLKKYLAGTNGALEMVRV